MKQSSIIAIIETLEQNNVTAGIEMLKEELNALTEASAKRNATRSAKAKEKRAEELKEVLPVLRSALTGATLTAKEVAEATGMAVGKVQYILLHDMKDELVKTEIKNKPNTYTLKV